MQPRIYNWPEADEVAITLLDDYDEGALPIDGTLASYPAPGLTPSVIFSGISRTVSITSVNDVSMHDFTITGTYRSEVVSETIAGPNAETVETTQLFDTVTSVEASHEVPGVSVGTGTLGLTQWYSYDLNAGYHDLAVQVDIEGTVNYSFVATLEDANTNDPTTFFKPVTSLANKSADAFGNTNGFPINYCAISLDSASTGSFRAIFLESGV